MKIEFSIANEKDLSSIIELCNECFNENTSMEYAERVYQETKNDPNQIYVIGRCEGKVVAHSKLTIIPTIYESMNTYAILNHICVKNEYRRHGFATEMLTYIENICKEKNCKCMELWSKNFREAAHSCYKRFGFIIEDAPFFSKQI